MKFGANTFIWSATVDRALFERMPSIAQAGFDGVELPLIRPSDFLVSQARGNLPDPAGNPL